MVYSSTKVPRRAKVKYRTLIGSHTLWVDWNHRHAAAMTRSAQNYVFILFVALDSSAVTWLLPTFMSCFYMYSMMQWTGQSFGHCYSKRCVCLKSTHTHTTVLLLFWNLSGTTRVSRYQKGKTRKVKTYLDLLEQEIVSGSGTAGLYASLHLIQTTTPASHHSWRVVVVYYQ